MFKVLECAIRRHRSNENRTMEFASGGIGTRNTAYKKRAPGQRRRPSSTLDVLDAATGEMPFAFQRIQTDRGRAFFATKCQERLLEWGIKVRVIKPPHLNGKVERSQRTDLDRVLCLPRTFIGGYGGLRRRASLGTHPAGDGASDHAAARPACAGLRAVRQDRRTRCVNRPGGSPAPPHPGSTRQKRAAGRQPCTNRPEVRLQVL